MKAEATEHLRNIIYENERKNKKNLENLCLLWGWVM